MTTPETMKAVVMHGPEDYRLEEIAVPTPATDELLIKVEATGVCASDLKCYHGAAKFWGDENRDRWVSNGVTPGHEIAGTVIEGSDEALSHHQVKVGDRIVIEQIVPCEECMYCQRGWYWMCGPHDMLGFRAHNGGMAEYMIVPPNARPHVIDSSIPPHHAAFAEPLSCSLHAVERANLTFDDVVVIAGAGPIGLGAIIGAAHKSPKQVIALDFDNAKLELAKKCGADLTLNPGEVDVVAKIKELTGGYGADVYIECTGHPSAVGQGLNLLRKLGTYVEYSVFGEDVSVDWSIISDDKELDVLGAHLGPNCWPQAIKIIESGVLPLDEICTHQYGLDDVQTALDQVADSAGASIKVSIVPGL
ncbi:zinc-binding dehydrogenase [Helcobacillus massiliensis]|uniref:Threonine dehydrogenase-like Zn-dependent dehydrogenase n=1 Tax=Helcobacillus massiliensis TaxID=521392 RepID=A0A839QU31_9MICO|nr:alcohol dehydrogenase catalytic domain-containing protein [Helcobacillus massiliensis]MBB3023582.1 threonine dehydrogenase-like Zn-dependent dehydrogenase [Helcobacillus massiliensis]MDK7742638.1 alcohol dehydrogenase catalytic domain-containing protein [Helcobacillus massiliensis]WOO92576.1 alcohol dehydrogenase catalytic domain-containing protein [Helcobacillus massiliensis]